MRTRFRTAEAGDRFRSAFSEESERAGRTRAAQVDCEHRGALQVRAERELLHDADRVCGGATRPARVCIFVHWRNFVGREAGSRRASRRAGAPSAIRHRQCAHGAELERVRRRLRAHARRRECR